MNDAVEELSEIPEDDSTGHLPPSSSVKSMKVEKSFKDDSNANCGLKSLIFPCLTIPSEMTGALRIGIGLMIGQQLTGVNVITFYTEPLCQKITDISRSSQCAFSLGFAQVIFSIIASTFIDRFPRRLLVVATGIIMTMSMLFFAFSQEV